MRVAGQDLPGTTSIPSRRTAAADGVLCPPAVEEHARALVAELHSTRPAPG
jgi:hypothetical protein